MMLAMMVTRARARARAQSEPHARERLPARDSQLKRRLVLLGLRGSGGGRPVAPHHDAGHLFGAPGRAAHAEAGASDQEDLLLAGPQQRSVQLPDQIHSRLRRQARGLGGQALGQLPGRVAAIHVLEGRHRATRQAFVADAVDVQGARCGNTPGSSRGMCFAPAALAVPGDKLQAVTDEAPRRAQGHVGAKSGIGARRGAGGGPEDVHEHVASQQLSKVSPLPPVREAGGHGCQGLDRGLGDGVPALVREAEEVKLGVGQQLQQRRHCVGVVAIVSQEV
mmetsp:Transcript_23959/g.67202  ORF Transcript_23959/g.67202 Transcript_23959/m.67202 type:complete len:279 (-) Transcript_23959:874-1710(-)